MADPTRARCPGLPELESFLAEREADGPVARHVLDCAQCAGVLADLRANNALLARLGRADLDDGAGPGPGSGSGPPPDDLIEGYRLHREIQRGGQGVVYRATQLATGRTLAVKVLLAGALATSLQRRRFEREIELIAGLQHPNIVTVYDGGVARNGCHYFTMQYVPGIPLDEWMQRLRGLPARRGRDRLQAAFTLFVKICDGISCAHQHGVIHRDLKPANIIVDGDDEPHILDFGLAKAVEDPHADRATVTREGAFLGTLAYASPEQTRGDPALVDVRSDVYALGVILYEMLTGGSPYPVKGEPADVLHAIAHEDPMPPSARVHRDGASLAAGSDLRINDEIDTIVLTALAKEKERRYQSAAALRDDLARFLADLPIEAKRDSGWYLLRKTIARHRLPAAFAVVVAVLLVGYAATLLVKNRAIRVEADKVRQINLFLEDTLGSAQPAEGGRDVSVRELLDESVHWIDIALADQPAVEAAIRTTVGNSYRSLGLLDKADEQLVAAWKTRLALYGEEHVDVAKSLNVLGLLRRDQGRLDEAERLFREGLAMRRRLLGADSYEVSLALSNLALVRRARGAFDEAEEFLRETLAIRRAIFGNVHQDVAMSIFVLAETARLRGDAERALRRHEQALDMRRAVLHRKHPDLPRSLEALALLHLAAGSGEAALPLLEESLGLRRDVLPHGHWQIGVTQDALGAALAMLGRWPEAERHLREALALLDAALDPSDERGRTALRHLVELYEAWNRPDDARTYRRRLSTEAPGE